MAVLIVPLEYPTIQEAVNASMPNDEILIIPGTYNENIVVTQECISIRGQSQGVVLEGDNQTGVGMVISGKNVEVSNITLQYYSIGMVVQGSGSNISFCICLENGTFGISVNGDCITIQSCGCDENGLFGIDIGGSNNCIKDNRCLNNSLGGIANSNSLMINTVIENNILVDPAIGVSLTLAESKDNKILGNAVTAGTGIFTLGDNTYIRNNVMQNCETNAIQINSMGNTVNNNIITGSRNGLQVSVRENTVENNIIGQCSESGMTIVSGENVIGRNIITNSTVGIRNTGVGNRFVSNRFFNNDEDIIDADNY